MKLFYRLIITGIYLDNILIWKDKFVKSKEYAILINQCQNWDDPDVMYEAARIIKKDTGEKVISVYYWKNAYKSLGYHFGACRLSEDEVGIVHDHLYFDLSNKNVNAFDAMLMHELGHYINGDLDKSYSGDEIMQDRLLAIMKGTVVSTELAADMFAVEHCGKNAVMQMLDNVIAMRKKRNTADLEIALKEFELRKQAVKRL